MTKIGKRLLILGTIALFAPAAAALVSVQSAIDREKVGVGDDVVYTLSVVSDGVVDIQDPRPPDLSGFELHETWDATAVSQKLMPGPNGMEFKSQRRREFNYRLRATQAGRQTIGAFEVAVDGKRQLTQPIVIEVSRQKQGPAHGGRGGGGGTIFPGFPGQDDLDAMDRAEEEMFRQLLQRRNEPQRPPPATRTLPVNPNEAFFVQVEVDKKDVYVGEQVTVSWYIYTRGQMETLDRVKFPDLRGFWKEIIEEVPTIQFSEEIVNGVPYRKALLASHALFPLKEGTAVIDEYKIKSRVRLPVGGMGFALGKAYEYTKSSQRISINVKPLPVDGRPSSFTGAVGAFEVSASVDSATAPLGQPLTVRVRFEGEGNAKGIELPAIEWPSTVEVYDTKSESRFFKNGRSYKQFDVLLIPRREGELEIPAFQVGIFNPATGKYETRSTNPLKLQIVAGAPGTATSNGEASPGSGPGATAPKPAESAVAAPKADALPEPILAFRATGPTAGIFNRPTVWAALYLAVIMALVFKARLEFGGVSRRRDLRAILEKRYKALEKTLATGNPRQVGADVSNMFSLVLGETAGEAGASQEISKVLERVPPSVRRDFGDEITRSHDVFQTLAFAPEEALGDLKNPERLRKEVTAAKSLLDRLVARLVEDPHVVKA